MAQQKPTDEAEVYLDDARALAWLAAHGIKVGPRYLKDMRWRGLGPETVFQGRTALTTEPWLAAWLKKLLKPRHPRIMAAERRRLSKGGGEARVAD
jgi:hypothetical protein